MVNNQKYKEMKRTFPLIIIIIMLLLLAASCRGPKIITDTHYVHDTTYVHKTEYVTKHDSTIREKETTIKIGRASCRERV